LFILLCLASEWFCASSCQIYARELGIYRIDEAVCFVLTMFSSSALDILSLLRILKPALSKASFSERIKFLFLTYDFLFHLRFQCCFIPTLLTLNNVISNDYEYFTFFRFWESSLVPNKEEYSATCFFD